MVCHSLRWHVFPGFTLLRLQGALQGNCPKWALCFVHFPGPSCSGSWVIPKGKSWGPVSKDSELLPHPVGWEQK